MNIAVIYGGESAEHYVSIITAVQMISNISKDNNTIIPIYINTSGDMYECKRYTDYSTYKDIPVGSRVTFVPNSKYLYKENMLGKYKKYISIDFCYIAMHGLNGEDGAIASIMNLSHIPYSSSDILGSSVALDKAVFKNVMFGMGINVVPYITILESEYENKRETILEDIVRLIGYPCIIKPSNLGSSIGISVVKSDVDIHKAIIYAFKHDSMLVVEKYVDIDMELIFILKWIQMD